MMIIGLSGKKLSGKDTFYEIASTMINAKCIQIAFADALYEEVAIGCGVSVKFVRDNKKVFRPILQWWGTDFRRRFISDEYWIHQLFHKLSNVEDDIGVVFITDVRFKNEAKLLEEVGTLVRIQRDMCDVNDLHISETDLDDYKFNHELIINNNGSIEEYRKAVRNTMLTIIKKGKVAK